PTKTLRSQVLIALQYQLRHTIGSTTTCGSTGAHHGRRAEEAISGAAEGSLRYRPGATARSCSGEHARLGDPQGKARAAGVGDAEALVYVMAGGVNYNGVWAGLGTPISPLDVHKNPFHVAGSDASGVVW